MTKEEYKAKKIAAYWERVNEMENEPFSDVDEFTEKFIEKLIDELGALPDKRNEKENSPLPIPKEFIKLYRKGFNACIAEAERMRDNKLSEKR